MLLSFILLNWNLNIHQSHQNTDIHKFDIYIQSSVLWTLALFFITEIYSFFHLLRFVPLAATWSALSGILFIWLIIQKKRSKNPSSPLKHTSILKHTSKIPPWALIAVLLGTIVLYLSFRTVPYNWDSMTYHLPRIAHWAQNGSIAHYATNILRQISSPVLAEFVNLHVFILWSGSDFLFNILQCSSYLTCAAAVYAISRKLRCTPAFCATASLLFASMPIAFAEALTTQVDNFATLWLLFFVYILLDFTDLETKIRFNRSSIVKVCILSLCVSFGYLTKPSVCIAMAIMAVWLLAVCLCRRDSPKVLIKLIFCAAPVLLLTLLPEIIRNLKTFSAIASSGTGQRQLIGTLQPLYVLVNFIKNFVYNLPNVYLYSSSDFLAKIVQKTAGLLKVDLNAPSIAEDGRTFFLHSAPNFAHDTAINPVIAVLFILCIIIGLLKLRKKNLKKILLGYSFTASVCFLIFCMVLRWEPYVTRYMVSYLALLCPAIAVSLQNNTSGSFRAAILGIICFVCFCDLGSMILYHRNMCVRSGADQRPYGYFTNRTSEYEPYVQISQYIAENGFRQIGLSMGEDNYEYPLWYLLKNSADRIEHVCVQNESAVYADCSFIPECIIRIGTMPEKGVELCGQSYDGTISFGDGYYILY